MIHKIFKKFLCKRVAYVCLFLLISNASVVLIWNKIQFYEYPNILLNLFENKTACVHEYCLYCLLSKLLRQERVAKLKDSLCHTDSITFLLNLGLYRKKCHNFSLLNIALNRFFLLRLQLRVKDKNLYDREIFHKFGYKYRVIIN